MEFSCAKKEKKDCKYLELRGLARKQEPIISAHHSSIFPQSYCGGGRRKDKSHTGTIYSNSFFACRGYLTSKGAGGKKGDRNKRPRRWLISSEVCCLLSAGIAYEGAGKWIRKNNFSGRGEVFQETEMLLEVRVTSRVFLSLIKMAFSRGALGTR